MSLRKVALKTMLLSLIAAGTVMAGNDSKMKTTETAAGKFEKATFAGGSFWCVGRCGRALSGTSNVHGRFDSRKRSDIGGNGERTERGYR